MRVAVYSPTNTHLQICMQNGNTKQFKFQMLATMHFITIVFHVVKCFHKGKVEFV